MLVVSAIWKLSIKARNSRSGDLRSVYAAHGLAPSVASRDAMLVRLPRRFSVVVDLYVHMGPWGCRSVEHTSCQAGHVPKLRMKGGTEGVVVVAAVVVVVVG